jgi:ribosomal protein S12 methylthiotransferase accessory factor
MQLNSIDPLRSAGRVGPDAFGSALVVTAEGHTRTFEDTYAWVKPLLRRVPITRVADATPIDYLGVPVWLAVTPMAQDLTIHAGKGKTPLAARLSAIMEAIERSCGESVSADRVFKASYKDLVNNPRQIRAINPEDFDLPLGTSYTPDLPISWVAGYDLIQREYAWVPLDVVISPAQEGVCLGVETNGMASGNGYTEASLHALYELIEREAMTMEHFFDALGNGAGVEPVRMVDLATLPRDSTTMVKHLRGHGLQTAVRDVTTDLKVPVMSVLVYDKEMADRGQCSLFYGYGCSLHAHHAVLRGITEAVQAHTAFLVGSRDTYEGLDPIGRRPAHRRRELEIAEPQQFWPFPEGHEAPTTDLLDELGTILQRLSRVGLKRCLVVDLARPDLEVPVVRVLVPGLTNYQESSRRLSLRLLQRMLP